MDVALKEEKSDKNKKILKFEYEILKDLQGIFNLYLYRRLKPLFVKGFILRLIKKFEIICVFYTDFYLKTSFFIVIHLEELSIILFVYNIIYSSKKLN